MNHRSLIAVGASVLTSTSLLLACGSYDNKDPAAAGAGGSTGGTGGTMGGTGGMTGGTGGSTGGGAGTGGATGGSAGTGGAAGATGGSAGIGGAAGDGAGTGGAAGGGTAGAGGEAAGAGGSGGAPMASCTNVTPCGGDVVGTWTVAGSCLPVTGIADVAGFGLGCSMGTVDGMLMVTGTWTATAEGTYMDNTSTTGTVMIELPHECLMVSGTVTACENIGGSLQGLGFKDDGVCVDNPTTTGCTCTAHAEQMGGLALVSFDYTTSGTYTTMDNKIVMTSDGNAVDYPYCVAGSTLTMSLATVGKTGTVSGTVVLTK